MTILPSHMASQTCPGSPRLPALQAPVQYPALFPAEPLGWTPWTPWSTCSQSCLVPGGGPGWRSRSRLCPSPSNMSCPGEAIQEEPCSPLVCPGMAPSVPGVVAWTLGQGEEPMRRMAPGGGQG